MRESSEVHVQVEISLYPMREPELTPHIYRFIQSLEERGLEVTPGPMSSVIGGPSAEVFDALREAFEASAENGMRIMVLKVIGQGGQDEGEQPA